MTRLHYGPSLHFELDPQTTRQVTETIGAYARRGGWITFADRDGKEWSILVTPGIPIWLEPDVVTPKPPNVATASDREVVVTAAAAAPTRDRQ